MTEAFLSFTFVVLAFIAQKNPLAVFYAAIAVLPWFGLDVDVGLRITPYLVCISALAFSLLPRLFARQNIAARALNPALMAFLIYAAARSFIQVPLLPATFVEGGFLRAPVPRAVLQVLVMLLLFAPAFLGPLVLERRAELNKAASIFVLSCLALAALGWIQLLIWYASGSNPFPIGLVNSLLGGMQAETREGTFVAESGQVIFRMNSFGGEPKDLGRSLAIGSVLLQSGLLWGMIRSTWFARAAFWFLSASMLATYSTSAIAIYLIGISAAWSGRRLSTYQASYGSGITKLAANFLGVLIACGVALYLSFSSQLTTDSTTVQELILARTVERESYIEDFDDAIVAYLLDHPMEALLGVGIGNIHLYADTYLDPIVALYAAGTAFSGKHGIVRLISDVGFVGLTLFSCAVGVALAKARRIIKSLPPNTSIGSTIRVLRTLSVVCVVLYFMNTGVVPYAALMLGALTAAVNIGFAELKAFEFLSAERSDAARAQALSAQS